MSKTTIRRWCTIKEGVFTISHNNRTEKPLSTVELAKSKVMDTADPNKGQFSFAVECEGGQVFTFQTSKKEEFEKWLSILTLSEELYRHYAVRDEKRRRGKKMLEESGIETSAKESPKVDSDGDNKSNGSHSSIELEVKPDQERKKTLTAEALSSIRKKITPRKGTNGRKQSYDLSCGDFDVNGLYRPKLVTDSILTMFNEDGSYTGYMCNFACKTDGRGSDYSKQWCVVREGKLHIYDDENLETELRTIPLKGCNLTAVTDCGKNWYCFRLEPVNGKPATFHVRTKTELCDWITVISIATELSGACEPDEENLEKIVEKLESAQNVADNTRSLRMKLLNIRSPENSFISRRQKKKSASVEVLSPTSQNANIIQGHLQEIHTTHLSRTLHMRWCVLSQGFLRLHENERTDKTLKVISVSDAKIINESNSEKNFFGFKLEHGAGQCSRFKASNKDDLDRWIYAFKTSKEQFTSSGVRLRDKANRPGRELGIVNEAFGEVKQETDTGDVKRRSLNRSVPVERRFSCGSLLDSEGKYCGYLTEIRIKNFCRTEIRRWCMTKNRVFYIYDGDRGTSLVKSIVLDSATLIDESDFSVDVYCFKLEFGEELIELHAGNRGEFEKWVTVIAVAIYISKNRIVKSKKPGTIREDSTPEECEEMREQERSLVAEREEELLRSAKRKRTGVVRQDSLVEERKRQFEEAHFFPRKSPRDVQERIKSLQEERTALKERIEEMRVLYSEVKKNKDPGTTDNKDDKDPSFKGIRGDLTSFKRHIGDIESYLSQLERELSYMTGEDSSLQYKSRPHSKSQPLPYNELEVTKPLSSSVTSESDMLPLRNKSLALVNRNSAEERSESCISEDTWDDIIRSHSVSVTQGNMDTFLREHTCHPETAKDHEGVEIDGQIYDEAGQVLESQEGLDDACEVVSEKDVSVDETALVLDDDIPQYENIPLELTQSVQVHLVEEDILKAFVGDIINSVLHELEEEYRTSYSHGEIQDQITPATTDVPDSGKPSHESKAATTELTTPLRDERERSVPSQSADDESTPSSPASSSNSLNSDPWDTEDSGDSDSSFEDCSYDLVPAGPDGSYHNVQASIGEEHGKEKSIQTTIQNQDSTQSESNARALSEEGLTASEHKDVCEQSCESNDNVCTTCSGTTEDILVETEADVEKPTPNVPSGNEVPSTGGEPSVPTFIRMYPKVDHDGGKDGTSVGTESVTSSQGSTSDSSSMDSYDLLSCNVEDQVFDDSSDSNTAKEYKEHLVERVVSPKPSQVIHDARLEVVISDISEASESRMEANFSEQEVIDIVEASLVSVENKRSSVVIQTDIDINLIASETLSQQPCAVEVAVEERVEAVQIEVPAVESQVCCLQRNVDAEVDGHVVEDSSKEIVQNGNSCKDDGDDSDCVSRTHTHSTEIEEEGQSWGCSDCDSAVVKNSATSIANKQQVADVGDIVSRALNKAMKKMEKQDQQQAETIDTKVVSNGQTAIIKADLVDEIEEFRYEYSDSEEGSLTPSYGSQKRGSQGNSLNAPLANEDYLSELEVSVELPCDDCEYSGASMVCPTCSQDRVGFTRTSVSDTTSSCSIEAKTTQATDTLMSSIDLETWDIVDSRL